jgi:hypothetical protein
MKMDDFKCYMDEQISEIIKYKSEKTESSPELDCNTCVFEWIDNNAESFRKSWAKKN